MERLEYYNSETTYEEHPSLFIYMVNVHDRMTRIKFMKKLFHY